MSSGRGGFLLSPEHPGQFGHALGAGDVRDARCRHGPRPDDHVLVGERRHLGEVRDDDDLSASGQDGQPQPHLDGRFATHTRVDLVEDERRNGVEPGEDDLEREHHARPLASRCTT